MARPSDIRLSFNEIPELYDKLRPSYPPELFNALFEMLQLNRQSYRGATRGNHKPIGSGAWQHLKRPLPLRLTEPRTALPRGRICRRCLLCGIWPTMTVRGVAAKWVNAALVNQSSTERKLGFVSCRQPPSTAASSPLDTAQSTH
jgi:hypothetical protein